MAFKIETFQNRHLPPGSHRIDAILSVTADGKQSASAVPGGTLVVGFIIDKSGSMQGDRSRSVINAVSRAIALLPEPSGFFVVAFDESAKIVVPAMAASAENKAIAAQHLAGLQAGGGTAMSTGLGAARAIFEQYPTCIRQAVFITDGKNESERKQLVIAELARCVDMFECDCWGVGTDWKVGEVQEIATALLGKAALIPEPAGIEAAFRAAIEKASAKTFKDVRLRLWTPAGATVVFVKQVNPTIEELTHKARAISAQVREYMTGAWGGAESRDFHVAVEVKQGGVGDEMLAARPSVAYQAMNAGAWVEVEDKPAEGRLFATWSADDSLTSRIDGHVAHYTGQDELASAIVQGLEAREKGDEAQATHLLGRAVQIAHASNNVEMTHRLKKVVEVVEAATGTIKLRKDVKKSAEMDLQLESRTTKRVAKGG